MNAGIMDAGWLLVSGSDGGGFALGLPPIPKEDGCWEAWMSPTDQLIAWDMGGSIRFGSGLEFPKAAGFHVDPQPHDVDGRLAWVGLTSGVGVSFCANVQGQIEWGRDRS